jgi:hypothetical protein
MKRIFFTDTNEHGNISMRIFCLTDRPASCPIKKNYLRMTMIAIVLLMLFSFGCSNIYSQNIPVYPIPSYNVVVDGYADFMNQFSNSQNNQNKAKRDVIVHLKSAVEPSLPCQATVWVYSLDLTTVLGPFSLVCGNELSVQIDERDWGVFVETEDKVIVDVWIE